MKRLILLFAIVASASAFAASPAATQQWVRNYVSTNTASGGVSQQWVMDYVTSAISNTVSYASSATTTSQFQTRAQNAVAMAIVEASMSGLHALTMLYPLTTNSYTNVKMADAPSGNGWTNSVYGCSVMTSATHTAVLSVGELQYNCSTFSNYTQRNNFTRIVGNITNVVNVYYASVSTNDWKTARGEN